MFAVNIFFSIVLLNDHFFRFLSQEKSPGSKLRKIKFIILDLKIINDFKKVFENEREQFYMGRSGELSYEKSK